ncbi:PaaI family thioesterase [Aurantivibrio infirmus]
MRIDEMATKEEVQTFFEQQFEGTKLIVESLGNKQAKLRRPVTKQDLRPGGTVSGPFMMALADAALYAAIFGELGITAMAVTTNMNINFLQRPVASSDLLAECSLLKVGKSLVVGEVSILSDGNTNPVAHAVGTFSIPK